MARSEAYKQCREGRWVPRALVAVGKKATRFLAFPSSLGSSMLLNGAVLAARGGVWWVARGRSRGA